MRAPELQKSYTLSQVMTEIWWAYLSDYSDYMSYQSTIVQTFSLLSGFTFTAITIILAAFPDPSQIQTQIILFVLGVLLNIFLLFVVQEHHILAACLRIAPHLPEKWMKSWWFRFNAELLGWAFLSTSVALMFFLWNLIYLAIASVIVTALFIIYAYLTIIRPFEEFLLQHPITRK